MAELPAETITIAEAADLLGVHRNTVRNRIKAGRYKAHKVVTAQGETFAIERDSLDSNPTNTTHSSSQPQVRHGASTHSQDRAIVDDAHAEQQLAVVQRLLAPFIEELGATKIELGRTREQRDAAVSGKAHAEKRAEDTEREREELKAEVAFLREIRSYRQQASEPRTMPQDASPTGAGLTEAASRAPDTLHQPSRVSGLVRRLFGRSEG
jgi:excisionase family DNA binding protein